MQFYIDGGFIVGGKRQRVRVEVCDAPRADLARAADVGVCAIVRGVFFCVFLVGMGGKG